MMKLLIDQGLPRSAASILRESGIDAIHVGEIGASTASDSQILQIAAEQHRTAVTLDADFHALLAVTRASRPSVIRVRIEGLDGAKLARLLAVTVERCAEDLRCGAAVTVQPGRLRIRHLPLL